MADETETYLSRPLLRIEVAFANSRPARGVDERSISYGEDSHQQILLCIPQAEKSLGRLVFYVHGVGWNGGNPRGARFIGRFLAEEGFTVAVCGYRPAAQSLFPAQLEDVFSGLTTVLGMAEEIGVSERFILAGFGSGAQLVTLLALDEGQQARHCLPSDRIAGVLSLSGILDFSVCHEEEACRDIARLMGGRRGWDAADPIRHTKGTETVKMLLVHGSDDRIVPADAARAFTMKVNGGREEGPARLLVVPGAGHDDILRLFIEHRRETPEVLDWLQARAEEPAPEASPELCAANEAPRRRSRSKKSSRA